MNVDNISADLAFTAGAELWVIENNFKLHWWSELDFRSGFLLSSCLYHRKKPLPNPLVQLLTETELKNYTFAEDQNLLLVGSAHHFHNNWILLWQDDPSALIAKLLEVKNSLWVRKLRFFSPSADLKKLIEARLTASFDQISYVQEPNIV